MNNSSQNTKGGKKVENIFREFFEAYLNALKRMDDALSEALSVTKK